MRRSSLHRNHFNFHHPRSSFITAACLLLTALTTATQTASAQEVVINEFMALNRATLADSDGDYSDWIELFNNEEVAVSLEGWTITDNAARPTKWVFPDVSIAAKGYLVVFASGKDRQDAEGELHTSFSLSGSGEYLGLRRPDGSVAHEYSPSYPTQQTDVSYGLFLGQPTPFLTPTPGRENTIAGLLPPVVSHEGGIQEGPIEVSLSVADPSLSIYYTLNGDRPTKENGLLYTQPISISATTPLSAVSVSPDMPDTTSTVVTRTFLFVDDILRQPKAPEGYPAEWSYKDANGNRFAADYEMDPSICQSSLYRDDLRQALLDLPSLCIVTNRDFIFSISESPDSGGIYVHTGKSIGKLGNEWERPASIEWYDREKAASFQINCGLRLHGGNSRNPANSAKHSFRVSFRAKYGASKLNFPIFKEKDATDRFDHLVLRAGYNYTWIKNGNDNTATALQRQNAQYIYDSFAKKTQLAMGHLSTHDRFVHLYINGLYWGLYDLSEKINNDFAEAYLGGSDEDYDVVGDHNEIIDGDNSVYSEMYAAALDVASDKEGESYRRLSSDELLDLDNYIDYMLINWYIGNGDWDDNNWRVVRSRVNPDRGFKYVVWDAETAFTDVNLNLVTLKKGNPTQMMASLKTNDEFRQRVSERAHLHLTNGGALTPQAAAETYRLLADEIDKAIICESARWGDYRKSTGEAKKTYTRNDHWLPRMQSLMANYFPKRTDILLKQLQAAGLYDPSGNTAIPSAEQLMAATCTYSDGRIICSLPATGQLSLSIYTTDGRRVFNLPQTTWQAGLNTIDLPLRPAIYIYRMRYNGQEIVGKVAQAL